MGLFPHLPIHVSEIRVTDIWCLLAIGAAWELLARLVLLVCKRPPSALVAQQTALTELQAQVEQSRKLGPSHFVQTSKLERQLLQAEKDVEAVLAERQKMVTTVEKQFVRNGNLLVTLIVFVLWYGVALVQVDDLPLGLGEYVPATVYTKAVLFPISYVGMGTKLSRWGIAEEVRHASIASLLVMWSAQVTVGKLFDSIDAYYLQQE